MNSGLDLLPLFENAPDLMFTQQVGGTFLIVNRAFERITGYTRQQARKLSLQHLIAPQNAASLESHTENSPLQVHIRTAAGELVPMEIHLTSGAERGEIYGLARDLRQHKLDLQERERTEAQLLEKTNELARFSRHLQLLHGLSNTNFCDLDSLCTNYLRVGCEIFGTSYGALTHVDGRQFVANSRPGVTPSQKEMQQSIEQMLSVPQTITRSESRSDGLELLIGTTVAIDEQVLGTISFWTQEPAQQASLHPQGREIIELMAKRIAIAIHQRQLTDELAHQASHDALTGLPNRHMMEERMAQALEVARVQNTQLAVVFIDLDRFKQINDTLGHSVGDALLQRMSARLKACIGHGDTLARLGGDEFTAILNHAETEEKIRNTVVRMLNAVRKPCFIDGLELYITASLGVSFFPIDGTKPTELLRNADTAMYVAKNRGKNDFEYFQPDGRAEPKERLEIENALRRAIDKGELNVRYQPQVEMNGIVSGLEVLLVWDHPKMGRVPPSLFIPIAEESGMIHNIGTWVLEESCRQAAAWQKKGLPLILISVNVSALQFGQTNFVSIVEDVLKRTGLAPCFLELEVTESLVMRDVEKSASRMAELRALGIRIAVDDFGTGYSSLSYLRRLPLDTLKIDQSFVQDVEFGANAYPLINTIVTLAHNMGLSVTAEGVESKPQFDLIRRAGCDKAQGHLFGGLLNPDQVERLLNGEDRAIQSASSATHKA